MSGFEKRVNENLYVGISCRCEYCQSQFGLTESEIATMLSDGSLNDEGGFQFHDCEGCRSPLGGDRYCAHDGDGNHYDVCVDCVQYLANGVLPDES